MHRSDYAQTHALDLRERGYDLETCQRCHGDDFAGKAPAPSCISCHAKGPTACDTCHGDPPTTAAHSTHLARGYACSTCHPVPTRWDAHASGHPVKGPARVTFAAGGAWDVANGTCSDVQCHGRARPRWTGGPAEAACGTCHGVPPATHAQSECSTCHPSSRHIDGIVDVGTACAGGCHGDAQSAAPASGAHRAHLRGGYFSEPIACGECHRVPAAVDDLGHIDSALPAELTFGPIATARGSLPAWNAGTCTNVYCHGATTVTWTGSASTSAYCGGCHALPPTTAPHTSSMTLLDCATCHAQTVTPFGGIIVGNGKHINGVIDAN